MSRTEPGTDWRTAGALIATLSVYGLTIGLTLPLLSLILEARGVDRTMNGLNAAMPAVGMVLASPFIPRFIAWLGPRGAVLACIAGETVLLLMLPAFDSLPSWFVIRFGMGVTMAGLFIAAESWLNSIAVESSRGRVMAAYMMVMAGGFAIGPAVIPLTGIEGWLPFLVAAGFIVVASVPVLFASAGTLHFDGTSSFGALSFFRVAPVLCACWLLLSFKEGAILPLLPVYGARVGLEAGEAALMLSMMGAGGLVMQFPFGWLADRFDRRRVMLLSVAGAMLGSLLLPLMVGTGWPFWVFLFCWSGAASGIPPIALALVGERFKGAELVTANAAFGVLWGVGSIAGPSLAGPAMDVLDPHGLPAVLATGGAVCLLLAAIRGRRA
ncbi:MAG: MFS transporter [Alphaproteobacteria bacterium]